MCLKRLGAASTRSERWQEALELASSPWRAACGWGMALAALSLQRRGRMQLNAMCYGRVLRVSSWLKAFWLLSEAAERQLEMNEVSYTSSLQACEWLE